MQVGEKLDGYTITDYINKGSYGSVYRCKGSNGEKYAVKVMPVRGDQGIPCLIEATVLSSYVHPYIVKSHQISAKPDKLCIFMEHADVDLLTYTRSKSLTPEELKKFSHQCLQGIRSLHQQGIIHCDIKPNNLLLFPDGNIKVADFSLSTLKISKHESFEYKVCATSYRPPEVLKGLQWNELVDVWAMGCTFYEMATGSLLVPPQCREEFMRDEDKIFWYQKTLSAINSWRKSVGDASANIDRINVVPSRSITVSKKWYEVDKHFNNLVNWMLVYDYNQRPNCETLLTHSYFAGMSGVVYTVNTIKSPAIDQEKSARIERYFMNISVNDPALVALTKEIYFRCTNQPDNILKLDTCYWIAHKILYRKPPAKSQIFSQIPDIVLLEMKICSSLNYRLHVTPIISDCLTQNIKPYREFPIH
jgi:cyclin-dependent kinase 7